MSERPSLNTQIRDFFAEFDGGIVAVYLFGSHAEGRAHLESDVDVGVLLDRQQQATPADRTEQRIVLASRLGGALHRNDIDVVVLNDAPPMLARRIVLDGIRLLCRDAEKDHVFRRDVQLRAADLAPFLRRTRRLKLQALRG